MPRQDEPSELIKSMVGVGHVHGTQQLLESLERGYCQRTDGRDRSDTRVVGLLPR